MSRHFESQCDDRLSDPKGALPFSTPARAKYLLRDGARVLKAGSFESVTCIAASRVPDGSEVVCEERGSVRAIFISRLEAFLIQGGRDE